MGCGDAQSHVIQVTGAGPSGWEDAPAAGDLRGKWNHRGVSRADTLRFRHSQAILAAAIVAFIGALPMVNAGWYLAPVLLIPLAVLVWAWRAGTDADPREVRVRALVGQRRLPWTRIAELGVDPRGRAVARLDDGTRVPLPAVRGRDLPHLVAVTGQTLPTESAPPAQ